MTKAKRPATQSMRCRPLGFMPNRVAGPMEGSLPLRPPGRHGQFVTASTPNSPVVEAW